MLNFAKSKMVLFLVVLFGVVTVANDRIGDPGPRPQSAQLLRTVADVPLPGPGVRFDYQSFDLSEGKLYIAHMNADHLIVRNGKCWPTSKVLPTCIE